ncbi:hypothetical protein ACFWWM_43055 [Streptomyces sp. NPDC058682]|nr:hypothetical protein [Streptomyces sp. NBC_01214]MCX4801856.1 hypothetical protein [Streptomyces sp. NBC_01214]
MRWRALTGIAKTDTRADLRTLSPTDRTGELRALQVRTPDFVAKLR